MLDVGSREQDDVPSAHVVAPALPVAQLVHPDGDVARIQRCLHTHADGLDDARGGVKNSHHMLGCAADITAPLLSPQGGKKSSTMSEYLPLGGGREGANRRLFKLIQQMQQSGQIRFTQLIWEGDGRWIHISYVPSDLRCQVVGE